MMGPVGAKLKDAFVRAASAASGRHACLLPREAADERDTLDVRAPYRVDAGHLVLDVLEPAKGTIGLTVFGYEGHFPTKALWTGERAYAGRSRIDIDLASGAIGADATPWGRLHGEWPARRFACRLTVRTVNGVVRERLTGHYVGGGGNGIDRAYFEGDTYVDYAAESAHDRDAIVALLDRWKAQAPLLDIGCATGLLLSDIERRCGLAGLGIDVSAWAVTEATRTLGAGRAWVADLDRGLPAELVARAPFRTIVMFSVLEHLADPRAALERLTRISTAGTLLLVETTNADSLSHTVFGDDWEGYFDRTHRSVDQINARTVPAWLEALGWRVADCRTRLVWDKCADPTHATLREWWDADARFRRLIVERHLGDLLGIVAVKA
jgi:2-polyprenyl-3-methyl-5-hydroxy-6-metoxy-1,4-benzoquinol methylase